MCVCVCVCLCVYVCARVQSCKQKRESEGEGGREIEKREVVRERGGGGWNVLDGSGDSKQKSFMFLCTLLGR